MSTREVSYAAAAPEAGRARLAAAVALHKLSVALAHAARQLLHVERAPAPEPVLEFYAQAGAPEGALYVDGKFVGVLPGVSRL